jgi:long-chain acyl-CoA synthetase
MNIVELIRKETAGLESRIAIIDGENSITYRDLLSRAAELCRELQSHGLTAGQRIAFHCRDGIDYVLGALALLEAGAAVVPIAEALSSDESLQTIERIDVHGILSQASLARGNLADGTKIVGPFHFLPRATTASAELDKRCRAIDAAFIRFSSGTTGESKGVVLSHRSIQERTDAANRGLAVSERDQILWVLAMSHHFVVSILLFLRRGSTIIVANQFFPFSIVQAAIAHPITMIYGSPVHYDLLTRSDTVPSAALKNIRLAISTSMKMPRDISARFSAKFGFAPAEAYGIIEIGLPFINTEPGPDSSGTVGKILPDYQLRISEPNQIGVGEVLIRGGGMFEAYFSPWKTREEIAPGGWFDTGDLGRLDEEGRLWLVGRSKTVLVCAGMKVFPEEVEEVINSMPGVRESRVFGREHAQFGQVHIAQVVLASDTSDSAMILTGLRNYCCRHLSAYKVPVEFLQVNSLPKTASGKIARATNTGQV